jgi:hypothetical protein
MATVQIALQPYHYENDVIGDIEFMNDLAECTYSVTIDTRYISNENRDKLSNIEKQNLLTSFTKNLLNDENDVLYMENINMKIEIEIVQDDNVYFGIIAEKFHCKYVAKNSNELYNAFTTLLVSFNAKNLKM